MTPSAVVPTWIMPGVELRRDKVGPAVAGLGGALAGGTFYDVQADIRQRGPVRSRGILVVHPGDAVKDETRVAVSTTPAAPSDKPRAL